MKYEHVITVRTRRPLFRGLPSLVPFICVLLILLLFCMICSNFVPIQGVPMKLDMKLPVSLADTAHYVPRRLLVSIDSESRYYINNKMTDDPIVLEDWLNDAKIGVGKDSKHTVIICMDHRAKLEKLTALMSLAKKLDMDAYLMVDVASGEKVQPANFKEKE